MMTLSVVPVLNPVINLALIAPYRRAIFNFCRSAKVAPHSGSPIVAVAGTHADD